MGYELFWIAIGASHLAEALSKLKLTITDEHEDAPNSELTLHKTGDWAIIIENHEPGTLLTANVLKRLSKAADVIACSVDEHTMSSETTFWNEGKAKWTNAHEATLGIDHLRTTGTLPEPYEGLRAKATATATAADSTDVDNFFDVPIDLAESITGYRHDRASTAKYTVLEKKGLKKKPPYEALVAARLAKLGFVPRRDHGSPTMMLSEGQRATIDLAGRWQNDEYVTIPHIHIKSDKLVALYNSLLRDTPYDPESEWGDQINSNIGYFTPENTDWQFTFADDGTFDETLDALETTMETYVLPFLDANRTLEQLLITLLETLPDTLQKRSADVGETQKRHIALALLLLDRPQEAAEALDSRSSPKPASLYSDPQIERFKTSFRALVERKIHETKN